VSAPSASSLESSIKAQAYGLGFDLVGITALGPAATAEYFDAWLARGFEGEMSYMARTAAKRRDDRLAFEGATHAVVVAMNYGGSEPPGPVARYARGDDYHDIIIDRLQQLHRWIETRIGRRVSGKPYVDTGPILERDLARRAGLGWFGRNTMLINPRLGSFFFLGALLLELEMVSDTPFMAEHCGSCRRCLDACPTSALVAERVLDATRCISYLTIEAKGPIPLEFHASIGDLLYGCDVCQEVCPWNAKFSQSLTEPAFAARPMVAGKNARMLARDLIGMSQLEFSHVFKGSPMKRAKLRGLVRNAEVVLGGNEASPGSDGVPPPLSGVL
jgi:epoxyqueuosine reductase